ncbi:hypothetical protein MOVI109754_12295 [Moritella viscosa]
MIRKYAIFSKNYPVLHLFICSFLLLLITVLIYSCLYFENIELLITMPFIGFIILFFGHASKYKKYF